MFSSNYPEIETPATKKPSSDGPAQPIAGQLWNVIEFSRQFPELTLFIVADSKAAELKARRLTDDEPLEFPPLVAPDPKELHCQTQKQQDEQAAEELALFAEGKLPPPEPPPPQKAEKMQFWRYLLTFFAIILALLWLHETDHASAEPLRKLQFAANTVLPVKCFFAYPG